MMQKEMQEDLLLTDEEDNILYHFNMNYHKNSSKCESVIEDKNEDSLQDIEIRYQVDNEASYGSKYVSHVFLQTVDGVFYDSELVYSQEDKAEEIEFVINENSKAYPLYSADGEICLEIPMLKDFSDVQIDEDAFGINLYSDVIFTEVTVGKEHFQISYRLLKQWDMEKAEESILEDFFMHGGGIDRIGEIQTLAIGNAEVYYMPYYYERSSIMKENYYIIWADLGCGQVLKMDLEQRFDKDVPLEDMYVYDSELDDLIWAQLSTIDVESTLENLFSNMKVGIKGNKEEITTIETPFGEEEKGLHFGSFGMPVDYEKDEYSGITECSDLIAALSEAMQSETMEILLQEKGESAKLLSTTEKVKFIQNEASGRIRNADTYLCNYAPDKDRKWYVIEQPDGRQDILIIETWTDVICYYYFQCYLDESGKMHATIGRKGIADTSEYYLLKHQGIQYLCIPKRDQEGLIEGVALYDFEVSDHIGTITYVEKDDITVCPYIMKYDGSGVPWYLNEFDKEFYKVFGVWKVAEYLGEADSYSIENLDQDVYEKEQRTTEHIKETYLGEKLHMWPDYIFYFSSASEYGYYYTSWENLYKVYGQPKDLELEAPFCCVSIRAGGNMEDVADVIIDAKGTKILVVNNRFFLLEPNSEVEPEQRTWDYSKKSTE